MFYNQPLSTRFGNELNAYIRSGEWNRLEIAVAWVRRSGVIHIEKSLQDFLRNGHSLSVTVGIDFDNTTKEGLESLIALESHGNASTYVYHNESSSSVFHPKIYLFTNDARAKLIVASNNITQAGLYTNTEAGLAIDANINDSVIVDAVNSLASWRDVSTGLAIPLKSEAIVDLVSNGYLRDEATVRAAFAGSAGKTQSASRSKRLFSSVPVTPPVPSIKENAKKSIQQADSIFPAGNSGPSAQISETIGNVLLMRVRKAHAISRPTQTQMPKAVATSSFFSGITVVVSAHDGEAHVVREARARGIVNTLKLEIPEMRNFEDPVIRFERTPTGILYEAYDSGSARGSSIRSKLESGRSTSPPETNMTMPTDPERSTWWRYI